MKMSWWRDIVPGALFILMCVSIFFLDAPLEQLKSQLTAHQGVAELTYVLILVTGVVLMPLTVMPIIPVATSMFGPFVTGCLTVAGWSIGAVIAFLIARHIGRPLLSRFISLDKLDNLVAHVPENGRFLMIVLLRLTTPVDLISYALGLSKHVGFVEYTVATIIGVAWFSFAFAYLGDALFQGNLLIVIEIGATSTIILIVSYLLLRRKYRRKD